MGMWLDLEDLVAGNPVATKELEEFVAGTERYEKLRKFNVEQFKRLYEANIRGEGPFDVLLDKFDLSI